MKNILYVVAVILIISWAIGWFLYDVSNPFIHVLLVVAVVAIAANIYKHRRPL